MDASLSLAANLFWEYGTDWTWHHWSHIASVDASPSIAAGFYCEDGNRLSLTIEVLTIYPPSVDASPSIWKASCVAVSEGSEIETLFSWHGWVLHGCRREGLRFLSQSGLGAQVSSRHLTSRVFTPVSHDWLHCNYIGWMFITGYVYTIIHIYLT